ncbi:MAG: hypothetical protein NTW03_21605 [Verrucomicrobia bacterium]|nr:hypothetical protein [Verrucomicrobiota bacterium]
MKLVSHRWPMLLLALAAWPGAPFAAEPSLEKQTLFGAESARQWSVAESVMEASTNRTRQQQAALHWHITVDHFAGEPNYPIGWPRANCALRETAARNWSGWDHFEMWIYTDTSRDTLPRDPAGLTLYTPDREGAWHHPLTELRKGKWVQVRIPLSEVPRHDDVRLLQLHISEANYRHQDQLDFYFDGIALLRYAQPTLLDFAAEEAVMFADARQIPLRFNLAGVNPGSKVEVACELEQNGKGMARKTVRAERGRQQAASELHGAKLPPGDYGLVAHAGGDANPALARLRLVDSPWPGKE